MHRGNKSCKPFIIGINYLTLHYLIREIVGRTIIFAIAILIILNINVIIKKSLKDIVYISKYLTQCSDGNIISMCT